MHEHLSLNAPDLPPFASWFMGGFESSTLQFHDLRRVDTIAGSGHDVHCVVDYELLAQQGIHTVRDSLRWHRIESRPSLYDWSDFEVMLLAAQRAEVNVIWDLCHFGLPDHVDLFDDAFPERFADFAEAAAHRYATLSDDVPWWCPINEISYWSHAAGAEGFMHPSRPGQAHVIKQQLVRASLLAMQRLREVDPRTRFIATDPLIHVTDSVGGADRADDKCESSLEAFDMLLGRHSPELGGFRGAVDVIGLNFYPHNQWCAETNTPLSLGMNGYRPLRYLLEDIWNRYRMPIVISETGADGDSGPSWLSHVASEVRAAQEAGVNMMGVCIYPVMDFPAWLDDKHCRSGLIKRANGARSVCVQMSRTLEEVALQQVRHMESDAADYANTYSRKESIMSDTSKDPNTKWPNTIAPVEPDKTDVPDAPAKVPSEPPAQPAATTGPTTPSIVAPQPADAPIGQAGDNEDERLDEALQETMPTSDPVSIKIA